MDKEEIVKLIKKLSNEDLETALCYASHINGYLFDLELAYESAMIRQAALLEAARKNKFIIPNLILLACIYKLGKLDAGKEVEAKLQYPKEADGPAVTVKVVRREPEPEKQNEQAAIKKVEA